MSNQIEVKANESTATISVLSDERAKRDDAFGDMVGDGTESAVAATHMLARMARDVAGDMRERATQLTDVAAPLDMQDAKQGVVALWRSEAMRFDQIARAIDTIPVSGETLKSEIAEMLIAGLNLWLQQPIETRPPMASMMVERAANLAQAYQGRILPEQK